MAKAKTKTKKTINTNLKKKKITLSFETEPGSEVLIAGSFNEWNITNAKKMKKLKEDAENAGSYSITMFLPDGEYEYKFYSAGKWYLDPQAPTKKLNAFGSFNNVLSVS